jgi:hypothetical protein
LRRHPTSSRCQRVGRIEAADPQRGQALSFHHFDPVAQALSKAERGHDQDIRDVREMVAEGLVNPAEAIIQFNATEPELYRFPAIDPVSFRKAVDELFSA